MDILIDKAFHGLTIKKVLLDRLSYSRAAVTSLKFKENGILVNGEHKTVRHVLSEGETLSLALEDQRPSPRIQPSKGEIDILYEDDDLLIVNKPGGMAVHPSKKLQDDTLAGRILYHRYPMVFRAAGRLDKDTSGVVISSKSQVVAGIFFEMIKKHEIKKEYLVLTESEKTPPKEGEISLCIRRSADSYIRRECFAADGSEEESQTALTRFLLLESRPPYHLFLASPVTGRTHQLRAHFSAIGFPLAGDTLYGKGSSIIGRQALHALRLTFSHPMKKTPLSVTAPLHEDFLGALDKAYGRPVPFPEKYPWDTK